MTTKEKIIKRLNEAFGFDIPNDAFFTTHIKRYGHYDDAFSWAVLDALMILLLILSFVIKRFGEWGDCKIFHKN